MPGHATRARLSRLSKVALLPLLVAAAAASCAAGREQGPVRWQQAEARQAAAGALYASDYVYTLYLDARLVVAGGSIPRDNCDELTGRDCFAGDRECQVCIWGNDRRDMIALGFMYDSVAGVVAKAPFAVRREAQEWLAAQRVGTWARMGDNVRARQAAEQCAGAMWVCEALMAYVEHREGNYARSGERFGLLLRVMPHAESCRWRDLLLFRDSTGGGVVEGRGDHNASSRTRRPRRCPSFEEIRPFWELADPLFTVAGNDRMTEHYARHVEALIHEGHLLAATGPYFLPVRHSVLHHSQLLRHGFATEYRFRGGSVGGAPPPVTWTPRGVNEGIGRASAGAPGGGGGGSVEWPSPYGGSGNLVYGNDGQGFVTLLSPEVALTAGPEAFRTDRRRLPETYRPPYGPVADLPSQTGFFRQDGRDMLMTRTSVAGAAGGSAAAADAGGGGGGGDPDGPALRREWQVRSWRHSTWRDGTAVARGGDVVAVLPTPWESQVVSVEALHGGGAWRARTGTRPPAGGPVALSSLVLVRGGAEPGSLEEAGWAMLPGTTVRQDEAVSLYWEMYGVPAGEAVFELRVRPVSTGIAGFLGGRRAEPRLRWTEAVSPVDGVDRRTMGLDIAGLQRGRYEVTVSVAVPRGPGLVSATEVLVER
jgi:hypothetical protein